MNTHTHKKSDTININLESWQLFTLENGMGSVLFLPFYLHSFVIISKPILPVH
jgi:hypothetical protein